MSLDDRSPVSDPDIDLSDSENELRSLGLVWSSSRTGPIWQAASQSSLTNCRQPAPRQDNMNIHISYEYLYVERRHVPDLGRWRACGVATLCRWPHAVYAIGRLVCEDWLAYHSSVSARCPSQHIRPPRVRLAPKYQSDHSRRLSCRASLSAAHTQWWDQSFHTNTDIDLNDGCFSLDFSVHLRRSAQSASLIITIVTRGTQVADRRGHNGMGCRQAGFSFLPVGMDEVCREYFYLRQTRR